MSGQTANRPRLILHVGFHKTGSTSIQETLSRLEMSDVEYAPLDNANHSFAFHYGFVSPKSALLEIGDNPELIAWAEKYGVELRERLAVALKNCRKPRFLISGESMSALMYENALREFRDFVSPFVSAIEVHAYLRPHAEFMASSFQQQIRMGAKRGFPLGVAYRDRMMMLEDIFGASNVHFYSFVRKELFGGDAVKDFAKRIGVEVEDHQIVRLNESSSLESIAVLFCHAHYGRPGAAQGNERVFQRLMVEELRELGNSPFRFSEELVRQSLKASEEDVLWVRERLGMEPSIPSYEGGVSSEAHLFELGVAQRAGLYAILERLCARAQCEVPTTSVPQGPEEIAALVDAIKDVLRLPVPEKTPSLSSIADGADPVIGGVFGRSRRYRRFMKRLTPLVEAGKKIAKSMKG